MQVIYKRTITGYSEDVCVTTHDFLAGSGTIDATKMAAAEARFTTFWNAIKSRIGTIYILSEYRWYDLTIAPPNPAVRSTLLTNAGTSATTTLPPQIACSITEQTATRRRWGRFYLPGWDISQISGHGRWGSTMVAAVAAAAETMYEGWYTDSLIPSVVRRSDLNSQPVSSIRVDDIPDIVRRRRWQSVPLRDIRAVV
jgi:hypothetical protein